MAGRDYDAEARERQAERLKSLEGADLTRTLGGEKVKLRPNVGYGLMLRLAELSVAAPMETFGLAEGIIIDLIDADEKTRERVRTFLRQNYTSEDLGVLTDQLVGDAAARPTQAPESSGNGRRKTGTGSKGGSSSTPAEASPA
jgi:hypothetical protein